MMIWVLSTELGQQYDQISISKFNIQISIYWMETETMTP